MASTNLVLEGVELMFFGMGSVFVFLTLLVFSIRIMARLLERFSPVVEPAPVRAPVAVAQEPSADVLEAIQLAIHQHRQRRA
ncbi:OadG family protein [Pseudomonas sp. NPDC078700]|uniref:OadG family protein n=1 Tax=Pseudomonas sp. NPDC078700 TaxID=3364424 RepID=UPI0037C509A4